ncbi:serine/threonine protein kinase [Murinocardiopsis flavida]|uniref:Serine/threonine protein kinase n=1 Tax=Murinocardiopsis flavida TaxID=645275 RepID=A0A2P8CMT3_9ACTN|nr:serine/threonine-protein kinase [Murinocardiopsis flavida]PSK86275.1 serine/threonine protein kinase [Murinocardiopsis flavida]
MPPNADTPPGSEPPLPVGFAPLAPDDPRTIGPFAVVGRIGAGGMGIVYGALDGAGTHIAVKVIHPRYAGDPDFRARFAHEADLLRRVDAECAPAFLGADPEAALPWLATEFVPGRTLKEHVAEFGPLDGPELLSFAAGTAEALAAIHAAGVLHRDIKPGNVILSPTGPRVLDFGIARLDGDTADEAGVYGTPGWLAPERLDGRPATDRTDVFAWGGLVVHAATGRGPFGAGTGRELLERTRTGQPEFDAAPAELHPLLARALDRDPVQRPGAAEAFGTVLDLAAGAAGPAADPRERLRSLLAQAWRGFEAAGRGAGPWIAAGSVAVLSASSVGAAAGAGAVGAAAGGGAGTAAGAGTIAGMSKATALILAGATATTVVTGGWVGGRMAAGQPVLPFTEQAASEDAPPRDGKKVEFRGMSIWIPESWTAKTINDDFVNFSENDHAGYGPQDWVLLYPGGQPECADVDWEWTVNAPPCRHVKLMGNIGIENGGPGFGPITDDPEQALFNPSTNPMPCPDAEDSYRREGEWYATNQVKDSGSAPVGDRKALHRVAPSLCVDPEETAPSDGGLVTRFFDQESWLMADAGILVVDDYGIDGLAGILADAEWGKTMELKSEQVRFRNLTFQVPAEWRPRRDERTYEPLGGGQPTTEDLLILGTDPDADCAEPAEGRLHYNCPHVKVMAAGGISTGYAQSPLDETKPFHPATQPYTCDPALDTRAEPAPGSSPEEPMTADLGDIGSRRAFYRVFDASCHDGPDDEVNTEGPPRYYEQRYWLLPESEILIVDEYRTEGLADILAKAEVDE